MWARPPTWCSRVCPGYGAVPGACADANELWLRLGLGRVPHGEKARMRVVGPQAAQGGDVELQPGCDGDVQAEPGCADRPQDVAVCKSEDTTTGRLAQADEFKCALVDLGRGLASRAAVPVELPAGPPGMDLFGRDALVLTVVELAEKLGHLRMRKARDLGGTQRALKWTGEHRIEAHPTQPGLQGSSLSFASCREW